MDIKLPGIGKKTEEYLEKMNIHTIGELITTYPRNYGSFPYPVSISDAGIGNTCGIIAKAYTKPVCKNGKITMLYADDKSEKMNITWFHPTFKVKMIQPEKEYAFYGKVSEFNGKKQMVQPDIYYPDEYKAGCGTLIPIYPLTAGLKQNTMRKAVQSALTVCDMSEFLPEQIIKAFKLMSHRETMVNIHAPQSEQCLKQARRRIKFEEFFMFMLSLKVLSSKEKSNLCPMEKKEKIQKIINRLPYHLTNAQKNTWKDIESDMISGHQMTRLVQGDVGTGKTIVAFLSLFLAVENGYQGVLMAPTEVLASQHYADMLETIANNNLPYRCVLLTGSTKRKKELYKKVSYGEFDIIIGTHAVMQKEVCYKKLGIVITDEQHRFGVEQRRALKEKGQDPHTLIMSATPIPRTIGLMVYGDLDVSIINEMPANRKPIKNALINKNQRALGWKTILREINHGHQAYIVCPAVEENENYDGINVISYVKKMRAVFSPSIQIGMLYGKMNTSQKQEIMERFNENEIQILVSTTVIEVGVNVPNATIMMIEDANMFGLSQLHQLRGRVGRGKLQGYCIFVNGNAGKCERLEIMKNTNDGFKIAEEDMKLRGIGELLGNRQSGDTGFVMADLKEDQRILKFASMAVEQLLTYNPSLSKFPKLEERL